MADDVDDAVVTGERHEMVVDALERAYLPDGLTVHELIAVIWDEYSEHCKVRGRVPRFSDLQPGATTGFARKVLVTNLIDGGDGE